MTFDLFVFWRTLLALVALSYCLIVTIDRVVGYWRMVHGRERHWGYVRKYLVIQLMRVRWRDVQSEVIQIAAWLVVLAGLLFAHGYLDGTA